MTNHDQSNPGTGRRDFLKAAVAVGGAGLVMSTAASGARAQTELTTDTKVVTNQYTAAETAKVTATAKKLTLADTHELNAAWATAHKAGKTANATFASYKTKSGLTVTIKDLNSLGTAHVAKTTRLYSGKSISISCCSCCPCCTASSVTKPVQNRTA